MPRTGAGYEHLTGSGEGDNGPKSANTKQHSEKTKRVLLSFGRFIIVFLSLWGLLNLTHTLGAFFFPVKPVSCNCGGSVAEAISMGCKFDTLSTAWLPAHCRDDELTKKFNAEGPGGTWTYYADQNGNRTLTVDEVSRMADLQDVNPGYWATTEWHVMHCQYYWLKERNAWKSYGKLTVEGAFANEYHVKHCGDVTRSRRPLEEITTRNWAGLKADGD
jgi:hypothetical protein